MPLSVALCCGALAAQRPFPEVTDLLTVAASRSRGSAHQLVLRAELPGNGASRHHVAGEGQLTKLGWDLREGIWSARPFFTAESLGAQLGAMRVGRGAGIEFESIGARTRLRSAEIEQVEAALAELRRALPAQVRCQFRLERIADGGAVVVLSGEEVFSNGEVVAVGDVERSTVIADIEVELAQSAVSGNPVGVEVRHGSSVLLRARPLPGQDSAVVEAVVRVATPESKGPMPGSGDLGAFDRVACRFDEAGVVFRVQRGGESRHEWTTLEGQRLALACRVDWTAAPARQVGGVWISPLLQAPVLGFRSAHGVERRDPGELVDVGAILSAVLARGSDDSPAATLVGEAKDGSALVLHGEAGQRLAAELDLRIAEALAPVDVAIEVFDAPAGMELPTNGAVPDGARALWHCAGPAVVGLPSCFTTGRDLTYMRDWDVEVAQSARIADPKVDVCEHGWFATVKALPAQASAPRRVEFALDRTDFVTMRQLDLPISGEMVGASDTVRIVLPRQVVTVEQAVTRSIALGGAVELDKTGVAVARRAAAQLLGPGRELVVRLRVQ
ncbi:MAG: hypothetical protein JNK49_16240 [Planctomycetes bacterium]|nr:hypothetical protein [Planctomycetota bacterium]